MQVLMINGSPNEFGCTYTALREVDVGLRRRGAKSEIMWIGQAPLPGCIGCGACAKNGRCVFDDTVNRVLERMERADALVVGSPVFFASPSGALVALLDRMFMAGKSFWNKPAAAIVSARRGGTTAALSVLQQYLLFAGMTVPGSNYYAIIHGHTPEETVQDLEGLQTMRILGERLAWEIEKHTAALAAGLYAPVPEKKIKTSYIR